MAILYSRETAPAGRTPFEKIGDVAQRGRVKMLRNTITLAAQATTDQVFLGSLPNGSRFKEAWVQTTVTLGTSTISIGPLASAAKYKAAAVLTATETPTPCGVSTAKDDEPLQADERVFLHIGVAALPASGVLIVDLEYIEP